MNLSKLKNSGKLLVAGVATVCGFTLLSGVANAQTTTVVDRGAHRIGAGVNYWRALENIDISDIDRDGFGYVLSYQYKPTMLGLGLDFEMLPDRFGSDAYAPQAYVLFGDLIYAGAGIGYVYTNDSFADDPFYSLRAGLDLEVAPRLHIDIYGQYRFESRHDLRDEDTRIDTDTVFLGAALRLAF